MHEDKGDEKNNLLNECGEIEEAAFNILWKNESHFLGVLSDIFYFLEEEKKLD